MKFKNKKTFTFASFSLLLSLCFLPLLSLPPDIPVNGYLVDEWEGGAGLKTDIVNSLAQTEDGYLWLGTDQGLYRFDGVEFHEIPLDIPDNHAPNRISSLLVDGVGALYIGHSRGLTKHSQTGTTHYSRIEGLPGDRVSALSLDVNGNLWIGTAFNYLARLSKNQLKTYDQNLGLSGKFITSVMEDSKGFIWAASLTDGLYRLQSGKFSPVNMEGIDNRHSLHTLYEDRDGTFWIGTNMGLFRKTGDSIQVFTTLQGLSDNRINIIKEDSDSNLWVGTVSGLNRIREKSSPTPQIEPLFPNLFVSAILEDQEKSLWVGTNGAALKRLRQRIFTGYSATHGLAPFISTIHQENDGTLWFGSDYGKLFYKKADSFRQFTFREGILDFRIRTIGSDNKGNILVGTSRYGIFKILDREQNRYTILPGFEDTIIQTLFTDSRGDLWIGTMGKGLMRYREGRSSSYTVREGLLSNVVLDVYEDKGGNLWVASANGLNRLPGGKVESVQSFLPGTFTLSIHQDLDGSMWVGTLSKGLGRLKDGQWQFITTENGLDSNTIFQILEDKQQHLWMSSSQGVMKITREDAEQFLKKRADKISCTTYGVSDGMNSAECNGWGKNAGISTRAGEFWFPTKKGASMVVPSLIPIKKLPPPRVLIQEIRINGRTRSMDKNHKLSTTGNIEITFAVNTFVAIERATFIYTLHGLAGAAPVTIPATTRSVKYANLAPGHYRFTLAAANSDGVWSNDHPEVSFLVSSSISDLLFLTLIALLFLFFFFLGYFINKKIRRYRIQSKKYQSSNVDHKKAEIDIQKLQYLLEIEKLYRDETVSLTSLADRLGLTYHQLSQLINERLNKNFYDLINTYRIEEAKNRLSDPRESNRNVLAIAFDVGFNTKAAFNRVFKKYTGMTPSEYRQKQRR